MMINDFSEKLKSIREYKDYSQSEMAKIMGVSLKTYRRFESGNSWPQLPALASLCAEFNISADYFIGHLDEPIPPYDMEQISKSKYYRFALDHPEVMEPLYNMEYNRKEEK